MVHENQYVKTKIWKLKLYFQFDGAESIREPAHVIPSHSAVSPVGGFIDSR